MSAVTLASPSVEKRRAARAATSSDRCAPSASTSAGSEPSHAPAARRCVDVGDFLDGFLGPLTGSGMSGPGERSKIRTRDERANAHSAESRSTDLERWIAMPTTQSATRSPARKVHTRPNEVSWRTTPSVSRSIADGSGIPLIAAASTTNHAAPDSEPGEDRPCHDAENARRVRSVAACGVAPTGRCDGDREHELAEEHDGGRVVDRARGDEQRVHGGFGAGSGIAAAYRATSKANSPSLTCESTETTRHFTR